jgi:hypothetical protein
MNRRRGRGRVRGSLGEVHRFFRTDKISASGLTAIKGKYLPLRPSYSSRNLTFFGTKFRAPPPRS